jgi:O-antigen/teichoic acid export membrane protein
MFGHSLLRTNILANLIGNGWIALLTLVATPIQIHLLGVEAYGLVGLITVLQIVFATLDLGLSASVTQTIASDRSEGRRESAALTNSVGTIYAAMAVVIGLLLWVTAGWIATRWLKPHALDQQTVLTAVRAIGIYVAFRWPISFYSGVLNGVQRMDVLNIVKAGAATLRTAVGIALIITSPKIDLFLEWFAISALIELVAFAAAAHWLVRELRFTPRISLPAIKSVWRFSLTMAAVALLSMAITQMDRLFVSKMLSLQAFGYYSLAYTAGIAISLLQTSINNAALPSLAEAASHGTQELAVRYRKVSELTSFAVALPCALLVFFGGDILRVWVNEDAALNAGPPLAWLAIGFFLNAAVSTAYLSAVATRRADIAARVNAIGALLYAPLLYGLIKIWGPVGAAIGWAIFSASWVLTFVPTVHRVVVRERYTPWLIHGLAIPAASAGAAVGAMKFLSDLFGITLITWAGFLLAIPLYAFVAYWLVSPTLRQAVLRTAWFGFLLRSRQATTP